MVDKKLLAYCCTMFGYGFYDNWTNMPSFLLKSKGNRDFHLLSDKLFWSSMVGATYVGFGPLIITFKGAQKLQEWEYEKM